MIGNYNLFLDDIREPWMAVSHIQPAELRQQYLLEPWVVVRSYREFVAHITTNGLPKKVSFDHDLAGIHYAVANQDWNLDPSVRELSEETGLDCAEWLCAYCKANRLPLPECYVHSANPVGSARIKACLTGYRLVQQL